MKEKPILFSGPMVRAILEGRKTQTRRVVKIRQVLTKSQIKERFDYDASGRFWAKDYPCKGLPRLHVPVRHPEDQHHPFSDCPCNTFYCPHGEPGTRLWVRETFLIKNAGCCAVHRASMDPIEAAGFGAMYGGWTPSIHMPRWASRITLEVTGVRVQRLQEISEEDARAEGIEGRWHPKDPNCWTWKDYAVSSWAPEPRFHYGSMVTPVSTFQGLWQSINGPDSWSANPWVWVIEFKRI